MHSLNRAAVDLTSPTLWLNPGWSIVKLPPSARVINAGKSTLNEDQACCEVLVVKRRPAGCSTPNRTPTTRRRSSLPTGEGQGPRESPAEPQPPASSRKYLATHCCSAGSRRASVAANSKTCSDRAGAPAAVREDDDGIHTFIRRRRSRGTQRLYGMKGPLDTGGPTWSGTRDSAESLTFHYWAMFDGHAGSGAAVVASRLLHHHIALHLQEVMEIVCSPNLPAPTCFGEEPINHHLTPTSQRALTRAASLRGAAGAPGSPSTPPTRFFVEKKVSHESLVVGAIENAFKDMNKKKTTKEN
ncbi:Protein phosphatase 1H [Liparis tanakae]|uniref:Protein phosphatase 1H n=1 Tax=Liparis tanakae TaxID=230148 RepID=A0A4Z2HNE8_9TELE|nr:Protein phosphatase 1H [Liparis tanakae]